MDKIWVNNSGFVEHITFGHLRLLQNAIVPLHADMVHFLVGLNDIAIRHLSHTFEA